MHPRHDEGNWAAGVLRQEAVTVQLVPSELEQKNKQTYKALEIQPIIYIFTG